MSFLSDIHSYWLANTTLNAALPASKVYTGIAPANLPFPYACITSIGLVPTPTVCFPYYATFSFQISVFDTDPDNVELLCAAIVGQFDYQPISDLTISCERQSGPILLVDPDTPQLTFHGVLTYDLLENRTLPNS